MSIPRFVSIPHKEDKDKKYSDELKDLPVVAKYESLDCPVYKHAWLNSTELLLDLHTEAKVWNMETNSQTKVEKKSEEEKEFLISSSTYIKQKIQISPNEFLIAAVTYKYFIKEKPNKDLSSEQLTVIISKNRAAGKPRMDWQNKKFASWGIYKKNKKKSI